MHTTDMQDDEHASNLVTFDTVKKWGFSNPRLATNAAQQMQIVDGVPADDIRQALIEAGFSVRDDVRIPDITTEIAEIFSDETRPRTFPRSARKPSLDDYDEIRSNR